VDRVVPLSTYPYHHVDVQPPSPSLSFASYVYRSIYLSR
jgi:hypothetical protein